MSNDKIPQYENPKPRVGKHPLLGQKPSIPDRGLGALYIYAEYPIQGFFLRANVVTLRHITNSTCHIALKDKSLHVR